MKKVILISITLIGILSFQSCNDPDYELNEYSIDYALIIPSGDAFYFITDDGLKLFPESTYIPWYYPDDTARVLVNYTLLNASENTAYDYNIFLNDVFEILTKNIIFINPENTDSIGNDQIYLHDAWIQENYFNVDFSFAGGYTEHMVNLVVIEDSITNQPLNLEFKHNAFGDPGEAWLNGIVAFDLSKIIPQTYDSLQIFIKFKEGYEEFNTYEFWYKP